MQSYLLVFKCGHDTLLIGVSEATARELRVKLKKEKCPTCYGVFGKRAARASKNN